MPKTTLRPEGKRAVRLFSDVEPQMAAAVEQAAAKHNTSKAEIIRASLRLSLDA